MLTTRQWFCKVTPQDFVTMCEDWRNQLGEDLNILASEAHDGEFAAFISYALAFPKQFIALIDTYDVTRLVIFLDWELNCGFLSVNLD